MQDSSVQAFWLSQSRRLLQCIPSRQKINNRTIQGFSNTTQAPDGHIDTNVVRNPTERRLHAIGFLR
jgi:hypothetical protein